MLDRFLKGELSYKLSNINKILLTRIESEDYDYLLSVNESDYIEHLVSEYAIEPIDIHFDDIYLSTSEDMIPAEMFGPEFNVRAGKSYKKQVISFHLPISGNTSLIRSLLESTSLKLDRIDIEDQEIVINIINFKNITDEINSTKNLVISKIQERLTIFIEQIESFNASLFSKIEKTLFERKNNILQMTGILKSLNVPIKKSPNTPKTFSISPKRKKVKIRKPKVKSDQYQPEPTIDKAIYFEMLKISCLSNC